MAKRDYYEVLGVGKNATEDEIKKALDKEPTAKQEEEEAEKAEEVVAKSKSGKKTRRKRATKKESGDIRDIFY